MTDTMIGRLNGALEGRYRIERELGEGGMATVFLAEDLRHDRKVALKVLKPELAAVVGAERFLAEIKTTANLQHPHILPLFDSGEADSFLFYVMPYVEGESLRETLDREKQLSVDEAVGIAEKVAGALHYAHEQDVVHRDIKPANILMSRGEPLVADFGIALALSEAGGGRITETGLSLGTPHYMSPEQASGDQSLDKRSDVYALGCILYEMLTGEPPYGGPTAQSVLARILTGDAQRITDLRRTVPPHVDAAVAKALEKLPADRFASAEAFVRALDDEGFRHSTSDRSAERAPKPGGGGLLRARPRVAIPAVLAVLAIGVVLGALFQPGAPERPVFRAALQFPEDQTVIEPPFGQVLDLSADGRTLVYTGVAEVQGGWQLWVRRADALEATPVPGSAPAFTPTLSPDGDAVAFTDGNGQLKVVGFVSGTSRTLVDDASGVTDWSDDGTIYYIDGTGDIRRVPAGGGASEGLLGLAGIGPTSTWSWGEALPGGDRGVWTRTPSSGDETDWIISVVDFETGEFTELGRGSWPKYLDSGHLAWVTADGVLLAAPFDPERGELTGPPVPVAEGIRVGTTGEAHVAFSATGDLVYQTGGEQARGMRLVWVGRAGDTTHVEGDWSVQPAAAGNWSGLDLSRSGRYIATTDGTGGGSQIWVKDLQENTPPYRITFQGQFHVRPRWAPDEESLTFISNMGDSNAPTGVWSKPADGSGSPRLVHQTDVEIEEAVIAPGGEWLVYRQGGTTVGRDIYGLRLGEDSVGRPLVATDADEKSPQLSPDGRWLAYMSDETGQLEIFVRPFPDVTGGKWQISQGGGGSPLWSSSGNEIFYYGFDDGRLTLTAAQLVFRETSVAVRSREPLFAVSTQYTDPNYTAFDVTPDDQRFLMYHFGDTADGSMVWVQNWTTDWRLRAGEGR